MKTAWLVSLFLHLLAIGALHLVAPSAIQSSRLVDVDLFEGRRSVRPGVKRVVKAARGVDPAVGPNAVPASNAALLADGGECESCAAAAVAVEYRPAPPYPADAQEAGLEGEILVEVRTDESGFVKNIELVKSSGHAVLDQSVVNTVKTWRLKPLKTVRVPINFHLET